MTIKNTKLQFQGEKSPSIAPKLTMTFWYILFSGFAVLTRQLWTGIVPLIMGLNFVLFLIPAHDAYLALRYGSEFDDYERRTMKLIPLVY